MRMTRHLGSTSARASAPEDVAMPPGTDAGRFFSWLMSGGWLRGEQAVDFLCGVARGAGVVVVVAEDVVEVG